MDSSDRRWPQRGELILQGNSADPDSEPELVLRHCPMCGSGESTVALTSEDYLLQLPGRFCVSRCNRCGALYQNPSISPELLEQHYPAHYAPYSLPEMKISGGALWELKKNKGYSHLKAPARPGLGSRMLAAWSAGAEMLPHYVPGGSVLEIGCASGERLSLLRELGWNDCVGIEYNRHAAGRARERGFRVHTGAVEEQIERIAHGSIDVVIAGAVLEHLLDPQKFIQSVAIRLKPGGQLIVSTITVDSLDFRIYREFWYNLDLPRHFTFFRKRELRRLLAPHFVTISAYHQYSLNDFTESARYRSREQRRILDRIFIAAGRRLTPVCQALALLRMSGRICLHARRK